MKSIFASLLIAASLSSAYADGEVLSSQSRQELIQKLVSELSAKGLESDDAKVAIKNISDAQKDGKSSETSYIVVIKIEGEGEHAKYKRVAHFQETKKETEVEDILKPVIKEAITKLPANGGPILFNFIAGKDSTSASSEKYAALSRFGSYLIFNICASEDEAKALIPANASEKKHEDVKPEEAALETHATEKTHEIKNETASVPASAIPTTVETPTVKAEESANPETKNLEPKVEKAKEDASTTLATTQEANTSPEAPKAPAA